MRFSRMIGWRGILLVMLAVCPFELQAAPTPPWQKVRYHQPAALHLKLTLNRDHFFQGEKIEATLEFSNDDAKKPFTLMVGTATPGAVFHAADANGGAVIDPLEWRDDWYPMAVTGPVAAHILGQYSLTLPINDRLRFDRPGVYTLYAQAWVTEGTSFAAPPRANLVSDSATITIVPLTPEKEKEIISDASKKIEVGDFQNGPSVRDGVEELSFLQTPSARSELIELMAKPELAWLVQDGLLSAPDPAAEANSILTEVRAGKLVLTQEGAEVYGELKTSSLIRVSSPEKLSDQERQKLSTKLWKARDVARQEVLAAAIHSSDEHGPAHLEALWAACKDEAIHKNPGEKDRDGGGARAALAAHQLDLPQRDVDQLLDDWNYWGSADFLPLVKRQAQAPVYNAKALAAWAQLEPDGAAPVIGSEIRSAYPKYFTDDDCYRWVKLPPEVLPRLTPYLREALQAKPADLSRPLDFVGQYGTKAILPDLIVLYRRTDWNESTDAYGVKYHALRDWIRWDPAGGVEALAEALPQHDHIEKYQNLVEVLLDNWTPLALPVVLKELESNQVTVVNSAVFLLVNNADEKYAEQVVSAMERIDRSPAGEDSGLASWRRGEEAYRARQILGNGHWHWSADQQKRLQAIIASSPPP